MRVTFWRIDTTIILINNKQIVFFSLSFLNRWNNNIHTNNRGKNSDNVREPNVPTKRLKPKLCNTVKSKTLSFLYSLTLIYTVLEK